MRPGSSFLHENSNIGDSYFPGGAFMITVVGVAGEFACLHLPKRKLEEIISSLMKALFECLQMFSV